MERYYQKEIETESRDRIISRQNILLVKQVKHVQTLNVELIVVIVIG